MFASLLTRFSLALLTLTLFSCTTPRQSGFEKIKIGMDKSSVLDIAGSPNKTQRWQGKDRWTYTYLLSDTNAEIKEIHFEEGRVVYVGGKVYPAVSAAEQDRRNEAQNKIDEQASFDVPGSTFIRVIKPNWEGVNPGDTSDGDASSADGSRPANAPKPKFERVQ